MKESMQSSWRTWAGILFALFLSVACGSAPLLSAPSQTPVPTASLTPTSTSLPPTQTPTLFPQALFCVAVNTPTPMPGCSLPTGQERDRYCVKKTPYTLIAIPVDVSYQVITPGFTCTDGGIHGGLRILACTGLQSFTFQIKVCQPGCAVATPMQSGPSGFCRPGYNYDSADQCCMAPSTDANGCITLKFGTRSCGG